MMTAAHENKDNYLYELAIILTKLKGPISLKLLERVFQVFNNIRETIFTKLREHAADGSNEVQESIIDIILNKDVDAMDVILNYPEVVELTDSMSMKYK